MNTQWKLPKDGNGIPIQGSGLSKNPTEEGVDVGLFSSGSISFDAADDLTTEKLSSAISAVDAPTHPDGIYLLVIDKPTEDTAGNLTINLYNQVKVDGTNSRDVLITTVTADMITGAGTYKGFLIQGLFIGEGTIKIGMKFATDSGAIEVFYKLYRL